MKCKVCGAPAVINMREHRLSLCAEHFVQWVPVQVQRAIEKHHMFTPDERVLVAVSGGKDSLGLWDILLGLGYHADGMYINLGIGGDYSAESQRKAEAFAAERQATLHVVDVRQTYGKSIPQLVKSGKGGRHACSLCGLIKRHIMNQTAHDGGYAAIATGHNLDDEVAVLFQNTLHWDVGYLARQGPVLRENQGLARKVKPLVRIAERESAAYTIVRGIDYIQDECPYSVGATTLFYKQLLNQLEAHSRGTKEAMYLSFLRARERYNLFAQERAELVMHACTQCGQLTTAPEVCSFCRLWARAGAKGASTGDDIE